MSLKGIFAYTIRAVGFGAVAGGLYWLILRMRGKNRNGRSSKFSRRARRFPQCLNCFNLRCVPA